MFLYYSIITDILNFSKILEISAIPIDKVLAICYNVNRSSFHHQHQPTPKKERR